LENEVGVDNVPHVKIRNCVIILLPERIQNESRTISISRLQPGSIVHRFRQGIIKIIRQNFTEPLPQREGKTVIIGTGDRAES
jgi:hypothetical protein